MAIRMVQRPILSGYARTYNASVQPALTGPRFGVDVATARIRSELAPGPFRWRRWAIERSQGQQRRAAARCLGTLADLYRHAEGVGHDLAPDLRAVERAPRRDDGVTRLRQRPEPFVDVGQAICDGLEQSAEDLRSRCGKPYARYGRPRVVPPAGAPLAGQEGEGSEPMTVCRHRGKRALEPCTVGGQRQHASRPRENIAALGGGAPHEMPPPVDAVVPQSPGHRTGRRSAHEAERRGGTHIEGDACRGRAVQSQVRAGTVARAGEPRHAREHWPPRGEARLEPDDRRVVYRRQSLGRDLAGREHIGVPPAGPLVEKSRGRGHADAFSA